MNDILLAFVTGLTTGGLSCLAVQGGLLAGSIAHEVEQNVAAASVAVAAPATIRASKKGQRKSQAGASAVVAPLPAPPASERQRAAKPIVLFLVAKLVA